MEEQSDFTLLLKSVFNRLVTAPQKIQGIFGTRQVLGGEKCAVKFLEAADRAWARVEDDKVEKQAWPRCGQGAEVVWEKKLEHFSPPLTRPQTPAFWGSFWVSGRAGHWDIGMR